MKSLLLLVTTIVLGATSFANTEAPNDQKTNVETGYYLNNGHCLNNKNQLVAIAFCQQNTIGYNGGFGGGYGGYGSTNQCVGYYYMVTGYGYQSVYCSGYSCSGYMLTNSMGQSVFCQ